MANFTYVHTHTHAVAHMRVLCVCFTLFIILIIVLSGQLIVWPLFLAIVHGQSQQSSQQSKHFHSTNESKEKQSKIRVQIKKKQKKSQKSKTKENMSNIARLMRRMRNALSHMCLGLCLRVCALAFCLTTIETNKSHNANGGSWHKLSDWISIFHFTLNWNVWESKTLSIPSTIASHSDWWCLIEKLYTIYSSIVSKVMNVCCTWRRILSSLRFKSRKSLTKIDC